MLGIETSCDETAAAVVTDAGVVLSDVVKSQLDVHALYGGVVPELASRDHTRAVVPVVRQALMTALMSIRDLDGIAVTVRPGLSGALLVGLQVAKGLAWGAAKPIVGVDHLVGHLLAVYLRRGGEASPQPPSFPFVGLLVSGGHTAIYRVDGPLPADIHELGATRDDAAGEAFDKVGKLLGLGYPGGPAVDFHAATGVVEAKQQVVPRPMAHRDSLEFSFSGIKSAMARHIASLAEAPKGQELDDLCAAFQAAVVDALVKKTVRAAAREHLRRIVVGGGVAANRGLRKHLAAECARRDLELFFPPFASCTDNAAMIAYAGSTRLLQGECDGLDLAPSTLSVLPRVTRKGKGVR